MVALKDWMRREGVSDAGMADRIGRVSAVQVPIEAITAGEVTAVELVPTSPRRAPALAETPR